MSQMGKHAKCTRSHVYGRSQRRGFTLLEVMIATAVTLLMMISLAQIFKLIGDSMKQGRAALELNNRLRSVTSRIRADIENITVNPNPPQNRTSGVGYLKIYDGPMTDYTYALTDATQNRFGDCDDIIMFTARAGDDWYTGKVPLFVLERRAPIAPDPSATPPKPGNLGLVTIAAQHAEICIFAEPVVTNVSNPESNPYYLRMNPSANYLKIGASDFPAGYNLYQRTLLIRPDLNLASGALPNGVINSDAYMTAAVTDAVLNSVTVTLPSPTCDMTGPHQQCDLSIRRVDPTATTSAVAANSLEDLVNPANRFAHVQVPLGNGRWSMPILALSPAISEDYADGEAGRTLAAGNALRYQSGFIHPAFILTGDRTGEDVLASNVLAFDVKAFDPSAPFLLHLGANTTSESGAAGSDDVVITPNDPGFVTASGLTQIASGEYVDINWGEKVRRHNSSSTLVYTTHLSGIVGVNTPTASVFKSGQAVFNNGSGGSGGAFVIRQPSYDTFTTQYEGDGILQAAVVNTVGVVQVTDTSNSGLALADTWRRPSAGNYIVDAGSDGIDNDGVSGVDDLTEQETSAPFPVPLRGLKITVRMEDPAARHFSQMSVSKEFVTQ